MSRQWSFIADMNGDGKITISDVWLWLQWLYFWPGDALTAVLAITGIGRFFEIDHWSYGGSWSGFFSAIVWLFVALIGAAAYFSASDARTAREARAMADVRRRQGY